METTTYDTPDPLRLEVNIPSGDVSVDAEPTTVTTLSISGERNPDDISVEFTRDGPGNHLRVERRKSHGFNFGRGTDLKVHATVPEGTDVTVRGGSTDLTTRGSLGSLKFHVGSGDATVESVSQDAEAKVASGDLEIGTVGGNLSFYGASGDLEAGEVRGNVTARTASGDVQLASVSKEVKVTSVSGDISIHRVQAGTCTRMQAVSGDIEIGIPAGLSVHMDLSSTSGSTRSDLDVSDEPRPSGDAGGETDIKASTVSGDIKVRQAR